MNSQNPIKRKAVKLIALLPVFMILTLFVAPAQKSTWTAPSEADELENPVTGNEASIKEGKKLYMKMCNICHGDKGKGDGIAGSALNPKPSNFTSDEVQAQSDGAIFWKLTYGNAPMAAYEKLLTEEQRWQLVSFIRTFKK